MPHCPQPGAGPEANSVVPSLVWPAATAKADNCCSSRVPLHLGQCGFSEPRMRTSNCFPQPAHRYSKIGIDFFSQHADCARHCMRRGPAPQRL